MQMKSHQEFQFLKKIIKDILGVCVETNRSRYREVVNAKMIYSALLSERNFGCSVIGKSIAMNHATILHYNKNFKFYLKGDANLRTNFEMCKAEWMLLDPAVYLTEIELKKEVISLRIENKNLSSTLDRLIYEADQITKSKNRLSQLFEMVKERTRVGTERDVLSKLNKFYNGVYFYGDR